MITDGKLDLGLATLSEKQKDANDYACLTEEEILLAVPADCPLSQGGHADWRQAEVTDLSRFSTLPFVRISRFSTLYDLTEGLFTEAGFEPRVLFSTSSNLSKLRIVRLGLGCALLPATYAAKDPAVVYFCLPGHPSWQITICSRRGSHLGKAERYYLDLCRSYFCSLNVKAVSKDAYDGQGKTQCPVTRCH